MPDSAGAPGCENDRLHSARSEPDHARRSPALAAVLPRPPRSGATAADPGAGCLRRDGSAGRRYRESQGAARGRHARARASLGHRLPAGRPGAGHRTAGSAASRRSQRQGSASRWLACPRVDAVGQGGLLDVALDPEFARNQRIYLSYARAARRRARTARASRARSSAPRDSRTSPSFSGSSRRWRAGITSARGSSSVATATCS